MTENSKTGIPTKTRSNETVLDAGLTTAADRKAPKPGTCSAG